MPYWRYRTAVLSQRYKKSAAAYDGTLYITIQYYRVAKTSVFLLLRMLLDEVQRLLKFMDELPQILLIDDD